MRLKVNASCTFCFHVLRCLSFLYWICKMDLLLTVCWLHHGSHVHETIKCHNRPRTYQHPRCCLVRGIVGRHHAGQAFSSVHRGGENIFSSLVKSVVDSDFFSLSFFVLFCLVWSLSWSLLYTKEKMFWEGLLFYQVPLVVTLSLLVRILGERLTIHSPPTLFFF